MKNTYRILQEADQIIDPNKRSQEKERMYGPMSEGMDRAAMIASGATGKDITGQDMYMILVALKLSRQSFNHKRDNLLDSVAYLGALQDYHEKRMDKEEVITQTTLEKEDLKIDIKKKEIFEEVKEEFGIDLGRQKVPTYVQYLRKIHMHGYFTKPRDISASNFHNRLYQLRKILGVNIYCDTLGRVGGRYVVSGSNRAKVDFILHAYDNGMSTQQVKKELGLNAALL